MNTTHLCMLQLLLQCRQQLWLVIICGDVSCRKLTERQATYSISIKVPLGTLLPLCALRASCCCCLVSAASTGDLAAATGHVSTLLLLREAVGSVLVLQA